MHHEQDLIGMHTTDDHTRESKAAEYAHQARKLAHIHPSQEDEITYDTQAAEAKFITPLDPVIETIGGKRLPAVPVEEAYKLNRLKDEAEGRKPRDLPHNTIREGRDGTAHGSLQFAKDSITSGEEGEVPLSDALPPSRTHPLFPPLPMYGPPTMLRNAQCSFFRMTSAVLSFVFLLVIVIGAIVDSLPRIINNVKSRIKLQDPRKRRPFYEEEVRRQCERRVAERAWTKSRNGGDVTPSGEKGPNGLPQAGEFIPTEGGPDPLVVDIAYYARRVGLDAETFEVQTEDGFIIELFHIFDPREYSQPPTNLERARSPRTSRSRSHDPRYAEAQRYREGRKKYPVLMIHGLLQSAGAFCCNDDDSLAFYLAKSGYDVWLGNNRCGFDPKHTSLSYEDPRMWAWNIRQMGIMDLPALIGRVLAETGFLKLALIAHSQGTTETFVALAKEQRPDIGNKISIFCALAPAVYAGPLIGKAYFKFMRLVSPSVFRLIFGIHSFIPLMMLAHKTMPPKPYSWMGYHVFSFLFSWSDSRWDRGLRDRMFQWAPSYVSAESMRWWLGRECFAKQRCILATREDGELENKEDEEDDAVIHAHYIDREPHLSARHKLQRSLFSFHCPTPTHQHRSITRGQYAWYDSQFPPLALWVAGSDDLVDGRRLLRRFDRGREPHVRVVHQKIIPEYEHLDVIWAMDAIEQVGKEVREVIWRTVAEAEGRTCRVPVGCNRPVEEMPEARDVPMVHSGGRRRMESISEGTARQDSGYVDDDEKMLEGKQDRDFMQRRLSEAHFRDLLEKGNPLERDDTSISTVEAWS